VSITALPAQAESYTADFRSGKGAPEGLVRAFMIMGGKRSEKLGQSSE